MEAPTRKNPYQTYEAILRVLSAQRIERVRRDHELIKEGWEIYFAIDPYDIGKFCFPFSPTSVLSNLRTDQIDDIARLQNGRYEAIYKISTRPILLKPYVEELEATREWAKWSNFVPTNSQILDRYLTLLRIPVESRSKQVKDVLTDLTRRDINSLIAIVTSIISIGLERLDDVLNNRLIRESPDGTLEDAGLALGPRDHVISKACAVFDQYFWDQGQRHDKDTDRDVQWMQRSRDVIETNNRRDALAIDQILQLNEIYNPQNRLILYLSSSPKSDELFGPKGLPRPLVNGKPYDLVRTARDLFIYMVYRGDGDDPKENAKTAIDKLNEVQTVIDDVETIREKFRDVSFTCEHCNRDETLPVCDFGKYCEGVLRQGEHIAERQEKNINLSMQKRLAQALESAQTTAKASRKEKHAFILNILSDVLQENKGNKALKAINQEMEANIRSSLTKSRFLSTFVTSKPQEIGRQVSCYLNQYPVRLEVTDPGLRNVLRGVIAMLPKARWSLESFYEAVGLYLKLDASWDPLAESELVRSFLYLILGANERANELADRYLSRKELSTRAVQREFMYLQCFTLWHSSGGQKAIEVADEGIKKHKRDGRFYHARSIIIGDLLARRQSHDYEWKDVIEAAKQSIELFKHAKDNDMVAVNYNNLAFAHSSESLAGLDVDLAVEYLQELIRRIPETEWDPNYPEFFHTKGSVLHAQYLAIRDPQLLIDAHKAAARAYELFPEKIEHRELKELIESDPAFQPA
jgi:tetratricopeptide (TPR) repeat protein